jgi:ribose transport system substrate-binding protein
MRSKKLVAAAKATLVLGLAGVAFAGCGSSSGSSGTASGSASTGATGASSSGGGKQLDIALITNDLTPYYTTVDAGAEAAAKKLNVKLTWGAPDRTELATQVQYLQAVAARKPDGIVMSVFDAKGMVGALRQVEQQGIPVITVDTDISDPSLRLGYIGSNNRTGGELAAQTMARLVPAGATVAHEGYTPGIQSVDDRKAGWQAGSASAGLKDGGSQYDKADLASVQAAAGALLQRNPNLAGIFSDYQTGVVGTATAVKSAGKVGKLRVVGFDAAPDEVELLRSGVVDALIVQKAYTMGTDGVTQLAAYLRDRTAVPDHTATGFVVATKANVDTPAIKQYIYRAAKG